MAITPDGTRAYISTPYSWSDTGYGAGYLASPWVTAVNLTTNTLGASFSAGAQARNVAISADGSRVYVTTPIANAVKVANVATGVVTTTISVAGAPNGIAFKP